MALDLNTGHVVWRTNTKAPLSGGTAAAGPLVVVGTSDGRVFALNAANGKTRWEIRINGEVLAPAAISEHLIAVRTGDGKLHGLSPEDGHELWEQEQRCRVCRCAALPARSSSGTWCCAGSTTARWWR